MIPSMVSMLNELDAEFGELGRLKAWAWADEKFDGAWSKAENRLYEVISSKNREILAEELEAYKKAILGLVVQFKNEHKISSMQSFLRSIAGAAGHSLKEIELPAEYSYNSLYDLSPATRMSPGRIISKEPVLVNEELIACELSQKTNVKSSKKTTLRGFGRRLVK